MTAWPGYADKSGGIINSSEYATSSTILASTVLACFVRPHLCAAWHSPRSTWKTRAPSDRNLRALDACALHDRWAEHECVLTVLAKAWAFLL